MAQALTPWTNIFPLGQLQNQAYGYLFPHGLFFGLLSWLPNWVTQRLWWGLLLFIAFAGTFKLLERAGVGTRSSRVIAAILYALSPRILATLGAISSEAWVVALAPWVLLPVVCATTSTSRKYTRLMALSSALAVLLLGAVNAVATVAVIIPAVMWWVASLLNKKHRKQALYFGLWWVPAGIAACFWWVGPLLILGHYSPPFTDFIESSGLTTRWLNLMEVLRGTTSWTPFLSSERAGGFAQATEPVFIVATLMVALVGLWGIMQRSMPFGWRWLSILLAGILIMTLAVDPFSPLSSAYRHFLDTSGAPLRNLHKFDPLVRLALVAGVAHALRGIRWPGLSRQGWADWKHPEKNPHVVQGIATGLLVVLVTATAWSGRIAPADGYKAVPDYWQEAAQWLNHNADGVDQSNHEVARTLILPQARFARQTWGNTRDEPAQPLLDVPWVVRDSIPLVQPSAIRALDGTQAALESGESIPTLAATLWNQGIGQILVRTDLTQAANTPGAKSTLRTIKSSPGFTRAATFGQGEGGDGSAGSPDAITVFRVEPPQLSAQNSSSQDSAAQDSNAQDATAGDVRMVDRQDAEIIAAGPEVLPRLAEADAALGRNTMPRTRLLANGSADVQTVTDTPALRDHNYGNVVDANSEIMAPDDHTNVLNRVRDYPALPAPNDPNSYTRVATTGSIIASSSAADPTNFTGAQTISGLNAAVDGQTNTAWRPADGVSSGQWMELRIPAWKDRLKLEFTTQGSPARIQVSSLFREGDSDPRVEEDTQEAVRASTTVIPNAGTTAAVSLPVGKANAVRITVLSSFGDFGISEVKLIDGRTGADLTPQRNITVPEPTTDNPSAINRWVFGQGIPEGTMRRTFTIPERTGGMAVDAQGRTNVLINTPDCADSPSTVHVDEKEHSCGETITLAPGEHTISSDARWVALSAAEPLLAEAIQKTPAAASLAKNEENGGEGYNVEASAEERIIFSPSDSNPGRVGTLRSSEGELTLQPITVNGWQQGWIIPAGASGTFAMSFAATTFYQGWLIVGLILALLLVAATLWGWWKYRGRLSNERIERPENGIETDTEPESERTEARLSGIFNGSTSYKVTRGAFLGGFAVAIILAARHPWGSESYAGDYWLVTVALLVSLVAVIAARFSR